MHWIDWARGDAEANSLTGRQWPSHEILTSVELQYCVIQRDSAPWLQTIGFLSWHLFTFRILIFIFDVTDYMKHSPSWETNITQSATPPNFMQPEGSLHFWTFVECDCSLLCSQQPVNSTYPKTNYVHAIPSYFFKFHFNITFHRFN
jgi:hypothetical protein